MTSPPSQLQRIIDRLEKDREAEGARADRLQQRVDRVADQVVRQLDQLTR